MLGKPLGKQSVSGAVLLFGFLPQEAKQLNCFYFLASRTSIVQKTNKNKTTPQASSSRSTLPYQTLKVTHSIPFLYCRLGYSFLADSKGKKKSLKLTHICCQLPLQGMTTLYCIMNVRSHRATYNVNPVLVWLTLSTGALHWFFR